MSFWPSIRRAVAISVCLAALFASAFGSSPPTPKRVVIIYPNTGMIPILAEFEQGFSTTLHEARGINLEIYREELAFAQIPEYREQAIAALRAKYSWRKIDAVVLFTGQPLEILPGVPTVFVGNFSSELGNDPLFRANAVPVMVNIKLSKTLDVARQLQPKSRKVVVITGTAAGDRILLQEARDQLVGISGIEVEYASDKSLEELIRLVSGLPRDAIVLLISYGRDPAGNTYLGRDVAAALAAASTAPLYTFHDTQVGSGPVGGFVASWERAGSLAGSAVAAILNGTPPAEITVPASHIGVYMFDWRQLKRWGFSERDLPPDSIVLNRIPTAWEQYRWRIVGAAVLLVLQSLLIIGLLINKRHRARAEASLRDMTGQLLRSQDDERRRIARDLHDGTGQHLSAITLALSQVLSKFPTTYSSLRKLLEDSLTSSRAALDEVRSVSYVLHPPILDHRELIPALHWYLEGIQRRTPLKVTFTAPDDRATMPPEVERTLFRIVQECISNVLRHSGATTLRVSFSDHNQGLQLVVEDNGKGMSPDQLRALDGDAQIGVGVSGMRERVRQFDGDFSIQSGPSGTKVTVIIPPQRDDHDHAISGKAKIAAE
jgi:signal transduction histidine kinase